MMLTEIPFLSSVLCYLSELAIVGNPVYPSFNYNDVRKQCNNAFTCYDVTDNLGMFANSGSFKKNVSAVT